MARKCFATTSTGNPAGAPETPALPPWQATCPADQELMRSWVNARLDDLDAAIDAEHAELCAAEDWGPGTTQEEARRYWNLELAKAVARDGDFTQLRRLFPMVAEFLNPLHRKRGERRRYPDWSFEEERTRLAIDDVYRIRHLIWARPKPHGYRKWRRPLSDGVTAEAIAASRHGVNESDVREAMKRMVPGILYSARNLPSLR